MTVAQFEMMLKAFPPQLQAAANGPQRHQFVEQYVQLRLAAQEAERRGLDKKPEVQEQMAIQHDNLLAESVFFAMFLAPSGMRPGFARAQPPLP